MKNIFLQLKPKVLLKQEALQKLLEIEDNEETGHPLLDQYYAQEDHTDQQNAQFLIQLIAASPQPEIKEKLFSLLVFFTARLPLPQALSTSTSVQSSKETIFHKVRFFSLLYKSTTQGDLKKWLIIQSICLIEQQQKISTFSNFLQNFDSLLSELSFKQSEFVDIYLQLINYLEKHLIYKKLTRHYVIKCLAKVTPDNACAPAADTLVLKLLRNADVSEETVALLSQPNLKKNRFFAYLQLLVLGNYEEFNTVNKDALVAAGVNLNDLERKVKIQALPRILSGITVASYEQIAEILKIAKGEVQSYIIEGIQEGLLKAKIDEFQETIIINNLKFRVLRPEERANLQKNVTSLAGQLVQIAAE